MIDALLYAVRDTIRAAGFGYGKAECEVMEDDGKPPPRCGNVFVSVHKGRASNSSTRNLDERFDFSVTLTMRVIVALDRVGDQQIARDINLVPLGQRQGFNAKVEQLRTLLHMNWQMTVLRNQRPNSANDNIATWSTGTVYGFCEPAVYRGCDTATLVGGEWLGGEPDDDKFAIKAEMRFEGARRLQPHMITVGPFV